MSTTTGIFNGNSRYSQDFQSVIERSVAIASLPITQLNQEKSVLSDQSTALSGLSGKFTALQTAVQGVANSLGQSAFTSSVSEPDLLSASLGAGVAEGTYSIEVLDIGAYGSSMTKTAWTAAASPQTYRLVAGGFNMDIDPATDDASAVAARINEKAGDQVRATVVNVGGSVPDYRLVLQSTHLGDLTPQLLKGGAGGVDTQEEQTEGRFAEFVVAGSTKVVESDTRTVSISDGLTLTLKSSDPGTSVDITVTRGTSQLSNALSALAAAYNATSTMLDQHRGTVGGVLNGQSVVADLSNALRQIGTWTGSGSVSGLSQIGLTLDSKGQLGFDASQFQKATGGSLASVTGILGSTSGGGFLKLANDALTAMTAAETGELSLSIASVEGQIKDMGTRVSQRQDFVDSLQQRLQAQMAAADALIASMEQQYNYLSTMFAAMDTASQQYK